MQVLLRFVPSAIYLECSLASVSISVQICTIKGSCREMVTNDRCSVTGHIRFTANRDSALKYLP